MALKKCKECGKEVSTKAKICPHCGAELKKERKPIGCGTAILAFILIFIIINHFSKTRDTPNQSKKKTVKTTKQQIEEPPKVIDYIVIKRANIRAKPNLKSKIVKTIPQWTPIFGIEDSRIAPEGWVRITPGQYIAKSLVVPKDKFGKAKNHLKVVNFTWSLTDFNIAKFEITVKNNSKFDIKDPQFYITYYSKSGSELGSGHESVYEIIPAKTTGVFKVEELAHSQSRRAGIGISDARWLWEAGKARLDW